MRVILSRHHIQTQIILPVLLAIRFPRIRKHLRVHRHIHDRIKIFHDRRGFVGGRRAFGEASFQGSGLHFLKPNRKSTVVEAGGDGLTGEVEGGGAGGAVVVYVHYRDLFERAWQQGCEVMETRRRVEGGSRRPRGSRMQLRQDDEVESEHGDNQELPNHENVGMGA